jgi:hypothetical protein
MEERRPATWHHLARRLPAITSRQQQTERTLLDSPGRKKLKWEIMAQRTGRWGGQEAAADRRTLCPAISAFCFPNFSFSARPPVPSPPKP